MSNDKQSENDLEVDEPNSASSFPKKNSHKVQQGEWLSRIAHQHGFKDWQIIWNHEKNTELREKRGSPDILKPGDILYIPDKASKQIEVAAGQKHRYQVPRPKANLTLVLKDIDSQPRAKVKWTLKFDGYPDCNGMTGDDGQIKAEIPPRIKKAKLLLPDEESEISLEIGHLDPVTTVRGIQARLAQLGYKPGPIDGIIGSRTREAIRAFQKDNALVIDGIAGPATRSKLQEKYGC